MVVSIVFFLSSERFEYVLNVKFSHEFWFIHTHTHRLRDIPMWRNIYFSNTGPPKRNNSKTITLKMFEPLLE